MAADKLKKLEARGRAAFMEGDINSATRYFIQALEKKNSSENGKSTSPKQKREKPRSKSLLSLNNNDESHVWILQANEKRNKKNDKQYGRKKIEDKESSVEMLDGIITDADTTIQTFPNYPMGYLRKASALILLNEWEEARQTYTTGLEHCSECGLLKSALYNLEKTQKITTCASNLDVKQLSDLINENSSLPPTMPPPFPVAVRKNKFRLQGQRKLTKKTFPRGSDTFSGISQIQTTSFRRRNSSSTDTHL